MRRALFPYLYSCIIVFTFLRLAYGGHCVYNYRDSVIKDFTN